MPAHIKRNKAQRRRIGSPGVGRGASESRRQQCALYKMIFEASGFAMHNRTLAGSLIDWFEDNLDISQNKQLEKYIESLVEINEKNYNKSALLLSPHKKFRGLIGGFQELLQEQLLEEDRSGYADAFKQNISYLIEEIRLDPIDEIILEFVFNSKASDRIESLFDAVHGSGKDRSRTLAMLLGVEARDVFDRLKRHSRLISSGLIEYTLDWDDLGRSISVCEKVYANIGYHFGSSLEFFRAVMGDPVSATLVEDDFSHIDQSVDFLKKLLVGSRKQKQQGVNILLYGPPGCGKTELCKTIATAAGFELFSIGENDEDGSELSRTERLSSLRFAQQILSRRKNVALLFDEMEDLSPNTFMFGSPRRSGSKIHQNRLLEQNPVPVLWTCNEIDGFDPAFLRRMTFVLELKSPPSSARVKIWSKILETQQLVLPSKDMIALSHDHDPSPALVNNAAIATRLVEGSITEFTRVLNNSMQAVQGKGILSLKPKSEPKFEPALINADHDLDKILSALLSSNSTRDVSFCLYGPPGTGKSQYARYLAKKLQMVSFEKRGSELLNCYIGETEKLIAKAFKTAVEDNSMLIIDEIEMFLSDRSKASQPWHLSQTNEFLTSMERHSIPWVATTNLIDRVDSAAQRRFMYKIKFDYLDVARSEKAFQHFFCMQAPVGIAELERLTPSDFALVYRKAKLLGSANTADDLLAMLKKEVEQKPGKQNRIGF